MENKHGNKLLTGFILGTILGGAGVLLFKTKKGKKILHSVAKEGMENLVDLKKLLTEEIDNEIVPLVETKPEPKRTITSTSSSGKSHSKK